MRRQALVMHSTVFDFGGSVLSSCCVSGGYNGVEDYRWEVLRSRYIKNRIAFVSVSGSAMNFHSRSPLPITSVTNCIFSWHDWHPLSVLLQEFFNLTYISTVQVRRLAVCRLLLTCYAILVCQCAKLANFTVVVRRTF